MKRLLQVLMCLAVMAMSTMAYAQTVKWQDLYTVKKKDTIYGIAKKYNISIDALLKANPDMQKADYTLKKGDQLLIPMPSEAKPAASTNTATSTTPATPTASTRKQAGAVNVGIMLPLHNNDGDGQRMAEYYRGVLMACDSLRAQGISTNVYAWNVHIDADVQKFIADDNARRCDIIFGPLYTKQVKTIGDFCRRNNTKLIIPFSISANDVTTNENVFQVYQPSTQIVEASVAAFAERFKGRHVVFIDCNDTKSDKGPFTSALRKQLEAAGMKYSITNLKSSEQMFAKAFSESSSNVVVLNTGRSPELNVALAKIDAMKAVSPNIQVSLFGYTEWLMYTKAYLEYFHKYDTYIPTVFFYNPLAQRVRSLENAYRKWFKQDMRLSLPRFALTGYDHAQFFIRGINKYGSAFKGTSSQNSYTPLQTPLKFKQIKGGGMQNCSFMLIHYKTNHSLESISY